MPQIPDILLCNCGYSSVVPADVRSAVFGLLSEAGVRFEVVADLCGLAARRDERLRQLAASDVRIAACYPRAVRWLFHAAGADLPAGASIANMRTQTPEQIAECLLADLPTGDKPGQPNPPELQAKAGAWISWFPAIDYDRCTRCNKCRDFCLFGVFGLSPDGLIEVRNPTNCKTNCPACARVCPHAAIIFPKYDAPPINGAEVRQEDLASQNVEVDLASLACRDPLGALRARSAAAKLDELKDKLDIPQEVLASLAAGCCPPMPQECDCSDGQCCCDDDADRGDTECDCDCNCGPETTEGHVRDI